MAIPAKAHPGPKGFIPARHDNPTERLAHAAEHVASALNKIEVDLATIMTILDRIALELKALTPKS
jgi:hypothetical protein